MAKGFDFAAGVIGRGVGSNPLRGAHRQRDGTLLGVCWSQLQVNGQLTFIS